MPARRGFSRLEPVYQRRGSPLAREIAVRHPAFGGRGSMRCLLTAVLLALAVPSVAWAGGLRVVSTDVRIAAGRVLAARTPARFDLVGLHWQGPGKVLFRTRASHGRWSAWRNAAAEAEDGPDRGSVEAQAARDWQI